LTTRTVNVALGSRGYTIHAGSGLLAGVGAMARELRRPGKAALITDEIVAGLYGETVHASLAEAGFDVSRLTIRPGEPSKSLTVASRLYDELAEAGLDRSSLIVALGGGVVGDLSGFVAATWMRGLPFIQVPTTLEADVDASVGGKTAVNHPAGKNMIGAFHQPLAVIIDVDCLKSLSARDFFAGMAESIKHGVIRDPAFFDWQEKRVASILSHDPATLAELIERNCAIKAAVVAEDEREETGVRAILNFGHTIGHAIESRLGYDLRHGECVAIGMVGAAEMARRRGTFTDEEATRLKQVLEAYKLPTHVPADAGLSADDLSAIVYHDKKVHEGKVRFTLPTGLGRCDLVNVTDEEIRAGIAACGV
jgi:3-dehydroquinate synthase